MLCCSSGAVLLSRLPEIDRHPYVIGRRALAPGPRHTIIGEPGTSQQRIIGMDIYPTMLAAAGLPLRPDQHVDGLNLMPLLTQNATLEKRPRKNGFERVSSRNRYKYILYSNVIL